LGCLYSSYYKPNNTSYPISKKVSKEKMTTLTLSRRPIEAQNRAHVDNEAAVAIRVRGLRFHLESGVFCAEEDAAEVDGDDSVKRIGVVVPDGG
jgi:hypothetical protein